MNQSVWEFSPLDSWFFRDSRPHAAAGAACLDSLFPPPVRTLAGAVRTTLGDQASVDWERLNQRKAHEDLRELIGNADNTGQLSFSGPFLQLGRETLYPAPLWLLGKPVSGDEDALHLTRLVISDTLVDCDLGQVRLPSLPDDDDWRGAKPLEQAWLSAEGYRRLLGGGLPDKEHIYCEKALFEFEPRLGIALQRNRRTVQESMLYQTRHLRPNPGLLVLLGVNGVGPERLPEHTLLRLGGEGRGAHVRYRTDVEMLPRLPGISSKPQGIVLTLLTHADLGGSPHAALLPKDGRGFPKQISIKDIALRPVSAVCGRAQREGGWDLANRAPRAVRSLVPAGSAWFCEVDGDIEQAMAVLHGTRIGNEINLGRGQLAAGIWTE